jgi:hypothetical protein
MMESQQPRDSLNVLIEPLQKWGLSFLSRDFFTKLGNIEDFSEETLLAFIQDRVEIGEFDQEEFKRYGVAFQNAEILETLCDIINYKEGGQSPWPYLAHNLEIFFSRFPKTYRDRTGKEMIKEEWIFHDVAGVLGRGTCFVVEWFFTSGTLGINYTWVKINQVFRSL